MTLQWAFQYEVLWIIITNQALNLGEKIQEVFQAFINLFILIDDLNPVSILLISAAQGLALTMIIAIKHKKATTEAIAPAGLALLGVGCVSCGGSLLSPLLSAAASNVSVVLANSLGNVVLLMSLVLSYKLLIKISNIYLNAQ